MARTKGETKMAALAVMPRVVEYEDSANLAKTTIPLVVSFKEFGNTRKIPTNHIQTRVVDKTLVKVHKMLLDSKAMLAVRSVKWEVTGYLNSVCSPFPGLKGARLAPKLMIAEITTELDNFFEKWSAAVDSFVEAYPELLEKAERQLGPEFNRKDYPDPKHVRAKFGFEYQFTTFGVPGELKEISKEIFRNESKKAQRVMRDASTEAMVWLRTSLAEMVNKLAESLSDEPTPSGKRRGLHKTTVEKLTTFLDNFAKMNVVNDVDLAKEVERARKLIGGKSMEALKTTDGLREEVRTGMTKIGTKLESLIENMPSRLFLEED
jgi:hypothetical protein